MKGTESMNAAALLEVVETLETPKKIHPLCEFEQLLENHEVLLLGGFKKHILAQAEHEPTNDFFIRRDFPSTVYQLTKESRSGSINLPDDFAFESAKLFCILLSFLVSRREPSENKWTMVSVVRGLNGKREQMCTVRVNYCASNHFPWHVDAFLIFGKAWPAGTRFLSNTKCLNLCS